MSDEGRLVAEGTRRELTARLEHFVASGIMARADGPDGYQAYHLTEKGLDFKAAIIALTEWGDRWAAPEGAPIVYEHEGCGGQVRTTLHCSRCEESLSPEQVSARPTAVMEKLQQQRKRRLPRTG